MVQKKKKSRIHTIYLQSRGSIIILFFTFRKFENLTRETINTTLKVESKEKKSQTTGIITVIVLRQFKDNTTIE